MTLKSEWRRCAPWLARALDGSHALGDVLGAVLRGEVEFWPGERSAAVGEVVEHPRRRDYHVWLAGGDLAELTDMERSASAFARALGCDRITIHGRRGWARALKDYRPVYLALAKDLKMSSKSTQKTKSTQSLTPWAQQQYDDLSNAILGVARQPLTPYDGPLAAGPDPLQAQAQAMAQANQGLGRETVDDAIGAARAAGGYSPMAVQAGSLADADLSAYMNPYLDAVAGDLLSGLDRGRRMAINTQAGDFTRQGAWGGSREGVADSLTNEAYARQASEGLNSLYSTGFQNAQAQAQSDLDRQLQAASANQAAGLQNAQLGLASANLLGGLGQQQQQMAGADATLLNGLGAQNQAYAQQGLDAAYQEFLRQQAYPMQQAALYQGLLGATPMPTTTVGRQTTSQSNPMQTLQSAVQIGSMLLSDARLKTDLEWAGHDGRRDWWDFRYLWDAPGTVRRGVIAQDMLATDPHAVCERDGWLMVDYGRLAPAEAVR
jgi:hypothetical protein